MATSPIDYLQKAEQLRSQTITGVMGAMLQRRQLDLAEDEMKLNMELKGQELEMRKQALTQKGSPVVSSAALLNALKTKSALERTTSLNVADAKKTLKDIQQSKSGIMDVDQDADAYLDSINSYEEQEAIAKYGVKAATTDKNKVMGLADQLTSSMGLPSDGSEGSDSLFIDGEEVDNTYIGAEDDSTGDPVLDAGLANEPVPPSARNTTPRYATPTAPATTATPAEKKVGYDDNDVYKILNNLKLGVGNEGDANAQAKKYNSRAYSMLVSITGARKQADGTLAYKNSNAPALAKAWLEKQEKTIDSTALAAAEIAIDNPDNVTALNAKYEALQVLGLEPSAAIIKVAEAQGQLSARRQQKVQIDELGAQIKAQQELVKSTVEQRSILGTIDPLTKQPLDQTQFDAVDKNYRTAVQRLNTLLANYNELLAAPNGSSAPSISDLNAR